MMPWLNYKVISLILIQIPLKELVMIDEFRCGKAVCWL
jgi:hypothetical protein